MKNLLGLIAILNTIFVVLVFCAIGTVLNIVEVIIRWTISFVMLLPAPILLAILLSVCYFAIKKRRNIA